MAWCCGIYPAKSLNGARSRILYGPSTKSRLFEGQKKYKIQNQSPKISPACVPVRKFVDTRLCRSLQFENGLRPAGCVSYSLPTSGYARRMITHILQVQNDAIRQPVNLHCVYISHKQSTRNPLKGTVSRDFLLLVFFMNQFPPSPWVYH